MRSASNFNPEWGYLAPAPSFMRTLRVILVATAIGATAGAAVVISLIDRPAGTSDKTASTAHAIVTSVQAAPAAAAVPVAAVATAAAPVKLTAPEPAPVSPHVGASTMAQPVEASAAPPVPAVSTQSATIAPAQASPNMATPERSVSDGRTAAPRPANGIAALSYASLSADDERATDVPDQAPLRPEPAEKRARHHLASDYAANNKNKQPPSLGAFLRRIFNPRPSGTSYYPDR